MQKYLEIPCEPGPGVDLGQQVASASLLNSVIQTDIVVLVKFVFSKNSRVHSVQSRMQANCNIISSYKPSSYPRNDVNYLIYFLVLCLAMLLKKVP